MKSPHDSCREGKWAEEQAACYLEGLGWEVLARNYRSPQGEIDIVAMDGETLVLIEVKSRQEKHTEWIPDAVSPLKIKRILKTAEKYIDEHKRPFKEMRVDVIWLIRSKRNFQLKHQREFA